jgi:hypothetical protein
MSTSVVAQTEGGSGSGRRATKKAQDFDAMRCRARNQALRGMN